MVFTDLTSTQVVVFPIKFEIVLYEKGIIEGKPLLETLQGMIDAVEKVIADLKPFTI